VIEDLDGGDAGPSRAGLVRAVSVVLAFSAVLGWAALSSPALRGPFATPDPAALAAPAAAARYAPEPVSLIDPAARVVQVGCAPHGLAFTTTVFVNGLAVSVNAPDRQAVSVSAPNGQAVSVPVPLAPSLRSFCLAPDPLLPFDRFAR